MTCENDRFGGIWSIRMPSSWGGSKPAIFRTLWQMTKGWRGKIIPSSNWVSSSVEVLKRRFFVCRLRSKGRVVFSLFPASSDGVFTSVLCSRVFVRFFSGELEGVFLSYSFGGAFGFRNFNLAFESLRLPNRSFLAFEALRLSNRCFLVNLPFEALRLSNRCFLVKSFGAFGFRNFELDFKALHIYFRAVSFREFGLAFKALQFSSSLKGFLCDVCGAKRAVGCVRFT